MSPKQDLYRYQISLIFGIVVFLLLVGLSFVFPLTLDFLWPAFLFLLMVTFTMSFALPLAQGAVSLMPMTSVAVYLVLGLLPAAWVVFCSGVLQGLIRARWGNVLGNRREIDGMHLLGVTAFNAAMHALSLLCGGLVFQAIGGRSPLLFVSFVNAGALLGLGSVYLLVNYLLAGVYITMRGRGALSTYINSLPSILFYEGTPLVFSPLIALIYTRLGWSQYSLFAIILVVILLIARGWDRSNQRLKRRVQELDSLQIVGQALSSNLQIDPILHTIYEQTVKLMPTQEFYVALYNAELDEVYFPLAIESGKQVQWRSRRAGNGLTEYILRNRTAQLIRDDVAGHLHGLGIENVGKVSACWLGVPILAGEEPLGVIALQSYDTSQVYDDRHKEILSTIAAQAAIAIQNAHLYTRTDAALARQVQEFDSILRTTHEGILLLSLTGEVLAVNRAFADILEVAQSELAQKSLDVILLDDLSLMELIGYTPEQMALDREGIISEGLAQKQDVITMGLDSRSFARTLSPVRDRTGEISDWLLVFRDITEEMALEQLREDMTNMLVHDLRSPLTVVMGGLALMRKASLKGDYKDFGRLLNMASKNSERILNMVNQLLDIGKLESGKLPLRYEDVVLADLFKDTLTRFSSLATDTQIILTMTMVDDLPKLHVDRQIISRVLGNLVDNALKFTPEQGEVRLWARLDTESGPSALLIGVSDTGPGIPVDAHSGLFEKFQQVGVVPGRRHGTGLGLPFCKLAIEAHGGRIWVESEIGVGTTFLMILPLEIATTEKSA